MVQQVAGLLQPINATGCSAVDESPAADIDAAGRARACPAWSSTWTAARYFWYHHSEGDTLDKLDPGRDGAAAWRAMAVMAYVVADLPDRAAAR